MDAQYLSFSKEEKLEVAKKAEFSLQRVVTWTLIFTNAYFLSLLIVRLF
jgi:hypothetical protein